MKLFSTLAALGCLISSSHFGYGQMVEDQSVGNSVGNSMWLFGEGGVFVFSPDGSQQLRHVPPEVVCEDKETFTGPSYRYCRFTGFVSDEKKYVWAQRGENMLLFDMNTGALVGSFGSCPSISEMEYHSSRDEVWVRCTGIDANSTDPSHLDVYGASDPSAEIPTNILLKDRALEEGLGSSGYSVIHQDLGNMAYLTDDSNPQLFQINLSTKDIMDTIDLAPTAHGLYEAAFSPVNGHIFVRALVCCSCGTEDSDMASCGRRPGYPVSPTTGVSAGMKDVEGLCGRSCSGIAGVDTIGVYEVDPSTKTVVATHKLAEGIGGDPYETPDGKYIVLMGKNGGKTVRILQPGAPGAPSTILIDLELEFDREGYEEKSVARDFAFVERNGKDLLIMPSGTAHKVAIVDLTNNFDVKYVTFSDAEFVNTAPHGRYRSVEWAVGTDYVWTNDSTEDEHYVIDVIKAELVQTITGIDRSSMLSVHHSQEDDDDDDHDGHDHGDDHDDEEHSCACEAEEFGFTINCADTVAMLNSLQFLQLGGCASDCSSDACVENYYVVQAHHDYCPEEGLPQEIEDEFHTYDEVCEHCAITRKFIDGAPDCPIPNCNNDSGNNAYAAAIEGGCLADCTSEACKENFFTLRTVHDSCPHDVLSRAAEEGLHDLEEPCIARVCNVVGAADPLVCKDHESEDHNDGNDDGFTICFSGHNVVNVENRGLVKVADLVIGDMVMVGDNKFEPIYSFGHKSDSTSAEYIRITTDTANQPLELSPSHMITVEGDHNVPASAIRKGDMLQMVTGDLVAVKNIKTVIRRGAYAPFTDSGKIIVNNIVASNYIAYQGSEYLKIGDMETPLSYQWIAHTFNSVHRLAVMMGLKNETYTQAGVSHWVNLPHQIFQWVLEQNVFAASALVISSLAFFGLASFVEFLLVNHVYTMCVMLGMVSIAAYKMKSKCVHN